MDVILLQDVDKVGLRGEVVSVSRGYMRNYLQPRKLAEQATEAKVAELARREAERARHEARTADQAEAIAETLRKTVLRFEVNAGERGTLFGSVTSTDITDELWRARKIRVDRRKIDLSDPIKRIGRYEIPITVFEGVVVEVKTLVVPIGGELPPEEELEAYAAEEAAEAEAAAEADRQAAAEAQAAIEEVVEAEEAEEAAEAESATDDAEAVGAEPVQAEPVEAEATPEPEASAEPEAPAEPEPEPEPEPEDAEAEGR
jgi:large subunit ribosomal protein L9